MKKVSFIMLLIGQLALIPKIYAQNIAINEIGDLPDTSAILDVSSTTKGFLTPRMTTVQQNAIPFPANGLLIYNTSDNTFKVNKGTSFAPDWVALNFGNGSTTNNLTSAVNTLTSTVNGVAATGVPMINTNELIIKGTDLVSTINGVASNTADLSALTTDRWRLTGNAGSTPGANFLGTTDNVDFIFKTNSVEAMRLTGDRRLLGLNVSNPIYRIQVEDPAGPDADIAARLYNANDQRFFPSLQLQVSAGTKAAPLPVTDNTLLGGLHFAGFDGGSFNDVISTGIVSRTTQNWHSGGHGSYLIFKTIANNTTAEMERMKIDHNGNIGMGTSAPGSTLDVKGTLRLSGSGSGFVGFSPAPNAGSTTYTLPGADGSNGQLLTTNGTGTLSWSSMPGTSGFVPYSGASAAINLGTNDISTTGTISTGILSAAGNTTLGTNTTNTINIKGAIQGGNALIFDGASTGGNTTTLAVADPTANNMITLPNTSGTIMTKLAEDAAPWLGGDLRVNNNSIDMTADLKTNQSYVGIFETAEVGEDVVFGEVLYFDFMSQRWMKANANAAATAPVQRMALEKGSIGSPCKMLIEGFVRNDEWEMGAPIIYLSFQMSGGISGYPPEKTTHQVQRVGIAYGKHKLHFKPSLDVKEL